MWPNIYKGAEHIFEIMWWNSYHLIKCLFGGEQIFEIMCLNTNHAFKYLWGGNQIFAKKWPNICHLYVIGMIINIIDINIIKNQLSIWWPNDYYYVTKPNADMIFVQNFTLLDFQAKDLRNFGHFFSRINRVNASNINNLGIFWF